MEIERGGMVLLSRPYWRRVLSEFEALARERRELERELEVERRECARLRNERDR